jgi:hypothetical protein
LVPAAQIEIESLPQKMQSAESSGGNLRLSTTCQQYRATGPKHDSDEKWELSSNAAVYQFCAGEIHGQGTAKPYRC